MIHYQTSLDKRFCKPLYFTIFTEMYSDSMKRGYGGHPLRHFNYEPYLGRCRVRRGNASRFSLAKGRRGKVIIPPVFQ